MARKKDWSNTMRGGQLLARGEVIQFMDSGTLLKCRVLSCLSVEDGRVMAILEVLEGERKGEKIEAALRAGPATSEEPETN